MEKRKAEEEAKKKAAKKKKKKKGKGKKSYNGGASFSSSKKDLPMKKSATAPVTGSSPSKKPAGGAKDASATLKPTGNVTANGNEIINISFT